MKKWFNLKQIVLGLLFVVYLLKLKIVVFFIIIIIITLFFLTFLAASVFSVREVQLQKDPGHRSSMFHALGELIHLTTVV